MTTQEATGMSPPVPKKVPGPGLGVLMRLGELRRDPLRFFRDLAEEYGGIYKLSLPGRGLYLVSEPEYVKHILQDNNRNYIKGDSVEPARVLVGNGLATSDGDLWLTQRRLMQPAFHRKRLSALGKLMTDTAEQHFSKWQQIQDSGSSVDLVDEMMALTLQIIVSTMFTKDISDEADQLGDAFTEVLRFIDKRSFGSWGAPMWLPTPDNLRAKRAVETIDRIVYNVAEERRGKQDTYEDLLAMLLQARDADTGEGMSAKQLRDEIVTIFFAGHETTALTLTWTFHELFRNPQVERKLRAEVDRVLGDRVPTVADLKDLTYTRMVLDEALRRYPAAWVFIRSSVAEDVIDGYRIPPDVDVLLSPYVTHHLPEYWDDPDEFRPERFDPAQDSSRHPMAYYPFGGGPRLCIGRDFALMEASLLLPMILQRFELQPAADYNAEAIPLVTLRPKGNVKVTVA